MGIEMIEVSKEEIDTQTESADDGGGTNRQFKGVVLKVAGNREQENHKFV